MSKVLGLKLKDSDWVRLESAAGSMGITKWARMILMREVNLSGEKVNQEHQEVNLDSYDFSNMEVVKRGPGRKTKPPMLDPKVRVPSDIVEEGSAIVKLITKGCDHRPFKRKDGLVVCENCGVRL